MVGVSSAVIRVVTCVHRGVGRGGEEGVVILREAGEASLLHLLVKRDANLEELVVGEGCSDC